MTITNTGDIYLETCSIITGTDSASDCRFNKVFSNQIIKLLTVKILRI